MRIVTPIDVHKWDTAGWNAVYFVTAPDAPDFTPVFALTFENKEAAEGIFQGFRTRFGMHDPQHDLRIAVIKGARISNPHAYAVIVGPNAERLPTTAESIFGFVSRINVMRPSSSRNLDAFLAEYQRHGRFVLAAAHLPGPEGEPQPIPAPVLGKYHLVVREAWQISENDPDSAVLDADDPPVIPPDHPDAPVLKALAWIEKVRRKAS
jgi:hypothetical protein